MENRNKNEIPKKINQEEKKKRIREARRKMRAEIEENNKEDSINLSKRKEVNDLTASDDKEELDNKEKEKSEQFGKAEREKVEEEMIKNGAKKINERNEKGQFTGSYKIEATPEQIEKALKSLEQEIVDDKARMKELEKKYVQEGYSDNIEEKILNLESEIKTKEKKRRLNDIAKRKEELIDDLNALEKEVTKEIKLRKDEEIEREALNKEAKIKEIEKEKEELIRELDEQFKEKKEATKEENKKAKLKTAREIALEDLENLDIDEEESEKEDPKTEEGREDGEDEQKREEFIDKVARKILNGETLNQKELDFQYKNNKEVIQRLSELNKEDQPDLEEGEEDKEKDQEKEIPKKRIKELAQKIINEENPQFTDEEREIEKSFSEELEEELKNLTEGEEEGEVSSKEQEKSMPENLAQFLEKETFGEDNESILKSKWGRRVRHLAAGVAGAKGLRAIIEKVPGATIPTGASSVVGGFAGGAITGVGLKLGHFGLEKWKETKNHENFSEGLESELEGMSEEESTENIEFNMARLNTNAEILDKRIKELKDEKDKIKEEEGFFWFLKEEGRDINATIKEHEKTLEKTRDQFRYLSVELKDKEDNLDVESLADKLMDMKVEQLKEKIEEGGPHADLLKSMLIAIEGTEKKMGARTKQKAETMKAIEKSAVGLRAKLSQEDTSIPQEILKSAAFAGIIGGVTGFVMESELIQDKLQDVVELVRGSESEVDTITKAAPVAEVEAEIDGITGLMQEEVMEAVDEAAGMEVSYAIESSDSVWSVTEEFLYDNIAEFETLSESEKTYVIDHITTTIESNPDKFGLELASGETIDNLLADKHTLDFGPLLDGQLEEALAGAESLSTEEVANILENNEKIRSFMEDHPNVRIDGDTIREILSETSDELTEEKIAEEIIVDGLRSESSTPMEQLSNIENWLEQMKNGELNEASFDFMADTSEGGRRELWVEQLAKIEGVSQSEMEYMIEESYSEIGSQEIASSASQEAAEEISSSSERSSWLESVEETFQDLKNGNASPEELESVLEEAPDDVVYDDNYFQENVAEIYEDKVADLEGVKTEEAIPETVTETHRVEGKVTSMDKWNLFRSFTAEFGEEILVESDVIELLEEGEITPQEFVDWMEDGAFDKRLDFGGDLHPKKFYVNQLKTTLEILENAENRNLYRGGRRMIRTQIERFILLGKQ